MLLSKESVHKSQLTSTSNQSLMHNTFHIAAAQHTQSASALQRIGTLGELESRAKEAGDDLNKYRDMLLWKQEDKRIYIENRGRRAPESPKKQNML